MKNITNSVVYGSELGLLCEMDAVEWLRELEDESVDMVFADPPYNLGQESWDQFGSVEEYVFWSMWWIKEVGRILKPDGHFFLCGLPEMVGLLFGRAGELFPACRWLAWHYTNKANMRSDWGRSFELILHFRMDREAEIFIDPVRIPYNNHTLKYPKRTQSNSSRYNKYGKGKKLHQSWMPHPGGARPRDVLEIPLVNNGSSESSDHPTQKPEELLRRLMLSCTKAGDVVVDPFCGSGTTAVVGEQLGRKWMCCELVEEYNGMAMDRLEGIELRGEDEWIEIDRKAMLRRSKL